MKYIHVKLTGWDTLRTSKGSNTTTDMSHGVVHLRRDGMMHPGHTTYAKKEMKMIFIVRGNREIGRTDVCCKEAHRSSLGRSGKRRRRDDGAVDKCIHEGIPGLSLPQIPARYRGLDHSSDFRTFSSSSPSSSYGEDRERYHDANDDVFEDRIDEIDGENSSEVMLKHRLALDTSDEFAAIIYHTPYFLRQVQGFSSFVFECPRYFILLRSISSIMTWVNVFQSPLMTYAKYGI